MNSAAFQFQTAWVVITGAPSSGKTSVIDVLAARGYATQPEAARMWIEQELATGRSIDDINKDILAKQNGIIETGLRLHAALDRNRLTFMDRGIVDSLSYLRMSGINTATAHEKALIYHYKAVFIFDRLPVVQDNVRTEDDKTAATLDRLIEEDYRALGYAPIRVPVMGVEARAEYILQRLTP
jgi:predicted ATPase